MPTIEVLYLSVNHTGPQQRISSETLKESLIYFFVFPSRPYAYLLNWFCANIHCTSDVQFTNGMYSCPGTTHWSQVAMGQSLAFYLPCTISGNAPYQKAHQLENCPGRCVLHKDISFHIWPSLPVCPSLAAFSSFLYFFFVPKRVGTFWWLMAQSFSYL